MPAGKRTPIPARGTFTFLFSDISGSTALLRELGQERYAQALADYQRLLRESCTRQGGHEVDTQGDAFFFSFARARQAASAAAEAQRLLVSHAWPEGGAPLRARIGLHTGEASLANGRYVGLSVHRAARVCATAVGGQILLSQASASMLEDEELGELRLRPLGRHLLKDFDRPVQLHQLDVPGLPYKFPRPKTVRSRLRRKHIPLAAGLAALIGIAVAIPVALIVGRSGELGLLGPTSAGIIDPKTNDLAGKVSLGFKSSLIAEGEGYVWIVDPERSTVTKIDPETREAVGRAFAVEGGAIPTGIAVGGGSVWVAVNRGDSLAVVELGPDVGDRRNTFVVDQTSTRTFSSAEPVLLDFGAGSLWALEVGTGEVWRIDPETGPGQTPLTAGADAWSIAYGHDAVWLGGETSVTRLDPDTGRTRTQPLALGPSESMAVEIGPGVVWFAASSQPTLLRIDPRTLRFSMFEVGRGPSAIAVSDDGVWVANSLDGTVSRVDPDTGTVARIPLGNTPGGIVSSSGLVWTTPG
jgi:class 3 adenylate cyclase/streptogramin lyase